jgi:hypothetical protein
MSENAGIVDRYIAMWNEADPERRRLLVADTVTRDAVYIDPMMTGEGVAGIDATIARAQAQFPGYRFSLFGAADLHHDRVRFSWSLSADGSAPVARGTDFATLAADGRLREVIGFLDLAPGG